VSGLPRARFFAVNRRKVPFSASLDRMTWDSIKLDLLMLPMIAALAAATIKLLF
jgi:hypothetical protein